MALDPQPVIRILDRIDNHPRIDTLCYDFDNSAAQAFRRDVRSLAWFLRSCPDLLNADEIAQGLTNLRNRYLVAPSEFRDLIEDAIAAIGDGLRAPASARWSPGGFSGEEDALGIG
jgi:hypothetical protein